MQVIATKSIHIIIQELMNLLHGNKFSPWEDFFVNPFGSDVINPNQLCVTEDIDSHSMRMRVT